MKVSPSFVLILSFLLFPFVIHAQLEGNSAFYRFDVQGGVETTGVHAGAEFTNVQSPNPNSPWAWDVDISSTSVSAIATLQEDSPGVMLRDRSYPFWSDCLC